MGLIHIDLFTTLDGVAQAPGGPNEDTDDGFAFGGWQAPLIDEVVGGEIDSGMAGMDALLLGRRTYDIFASYWPHAHGDIARLFNRLPKYVASRQTPALEWAPSTLLGADVANAVRELRGAVMQRYALAPGTPAVGDMAAADEAGDEAPR
jgi:dihydrofolate reductase